MRLIYPVGAFYAKNTPWEAPLGTVANIPPKVLYSAHMEQETNTQAGAGAQSAPHEEKKTDEMGKKKLLSILSYIGPLVVVSYLLEKQDAEVKFHIGQGAVLLVIEVGAWFIGMLFWPFFGITQLINLAAFILSIVGIIHVLQGKQKELPLVGGYSKYFAPLGL